jgi:hypothetical protein
VAPGRGHGVNADGRKAQKVSPVSPSVGRHVTTAPVPAHLYNLFHVVPWLRRLVAGLSPRRPGFAPGSVHVRFAADRVAQRQVFSEFFSFPCHCHSTMILHSHAIWRMSKRLVFGRSSETWRHPTDMCDALCP